MDKIAIVIPAHNEQDRIGATLRAYAAYAQQELAGICNAQLLVVLNGCSDNTAAVVKKIAQEYPGIIDMLDLQEAGKGLAIIAGFKHALSTDADYIGFVDADMATQPIYFFDLYRNMGDADGAIASRYMPDSVVTPKRPWIKMWGRQFIYNSLVRLLFGISYIDYQCGAKLFKRSVIQAVINDMHEGQWAFDVELLYLAHKAGFTVKELPTVWHDQEGSKLATFSSGMRMLRSLFVLKSRHKG